MTTSTIDIRRSDDRFHTQAGWLNSKHSFSFSNHFDPENTHHGQLLVLNDDRVAGGAGFGTHPHQNMEIVTWVLDGKLEHNDSEGNHGLLYPGLAQRMSAGRGIRHSEQNASATDEVHFIQMWVLPDTKSIDPGYEQMDVNTELGKGDLVAVASGKGDLVAVASGKGHDGAISIAQKDAVLWAARLSPGQQIHVPKATFGHVFIAKGNAELEANGRLDTGDAVRLTLTDELTLTATEGSAEVLIWTTGAMQ